MKLLCSSSYLKELEVIAKKLICVGIPIAVFRDSSDAPLGIWIQQAADFPLALRLLVNREKPRDVPHWATVFDVVPPAAEPAAPPPSQPAAVSSPDVPNSRKVVFIQSDGP